MPSYDELIRAAVTANAEGRLDQAVSLARSILSSKPDDIQAMLLIGIAGVKKNDPALALPFLESVLNKDPSSADAPFWLSMSHRNQGRLEDAVRFAELAASRNEGNVHVQNHWGMCLMDTGRPDEALIRFLRASQLVPKPSAYLLNAGRALRAMGRTRDAIEAFSDALAIGPVRPDSLFQLGDAYMAIPEPKRAAECAREILKMEPDSLPGNLLMARAMIGDGQVSEGAEYAKRAMSLAPGNAVPVAYYGRALQSLGEIEEADAQFRRSIELEPRQGFAYYSLVTNHKVKEDERPLVAKMEELAGDEGLPPRELVQLEYGLGKAHEDLGNYEAAMAHFDQANVLDHVVKTGVVAPFQPQQLDHTASFLIRTFTKSFLADHASAGSESEMPIFVVGMMRSGTTLAEQIVSSHPQVVGAGEQLFWPERTGTKQGMVWSEQAELFKGAGGLDKTRLKGLADEYLALLSNIAPGKPRVVDKMNTNYLLLGLLHLAYPNARIINMLRNPIDTCISIWATPVATGIDLCASKENIVFAYRQYQRVMAHWRGVLPADRLLDVHYEELVSDRERLTRQMIDFCGLEWDEACMSPESNVRSVKTPSVWQVRQPVYKTSVERWRRYEPWLGAFSQLSD